jgi:hypothetical protein
MEKAGFKRGTILGNEEYRRDTAEGGNHTINANRKGDNGKTVTYLTRRGGAEGDKMRHTTHDSVEDAIAASHQESPPKDKIKPEAFAEDDEDTMMAYGGPAVRATQEPGVPQRKPDDKRWPKEDYMGEQWDGGPDYEHASLTMGPDKKEYDAEQWVAEGGEIGSDSNDFMNDDEDHASSIADAIMAKRAARKAALDTGESDIQENADDNDQTPYVRANAHALEDVYDDSQISKQPLDSKGDMEEENSENMQDNSIVSKIRAKLKAKRGF